MIYRLTKKIDQKAVVPEKKKDISLEVKAFWDLNFKTLLRQTKEG